MIRPIYDMATNHGNGTGKRMRYGGSWDFQIGDVSGSIEV